MGIISRLFGRSAPESRADAGFSALSPALAEVYANGGYQHAESLAAVASCTRLISSAIATLPATLVIDGATGREPAPPSASAWGLLERPAQRRSWPNWAGAVVREMLLNGNAVCRIETDGRGAVIALTLIPWSWVTIQVVGDGRLAYDIWHQHPEAQLLRLPPRLTESDVVHFRMASETGIVGQSILSRARGPVREGLAIETLASANWRNGMRPSAILTAPAYLAPDIRKRFREELLPEFTGALAAGRVPVLEGGWELKTAALSSVDSEFLATRQLNTEQVCSLFGVPSILLQIGQRLPTDMAPFVTQFAQLALAPIVTSIEAEFDHVILPDGMHLAIDLDGLMRGSFSATVAALAALLQSGAVSANDVRAELDWPPHPDGDGLHTGAAPNWPADGPGSKHLGASPGPPGDAPPEPGTHQGQGRAAP